MEEIQRGTSLEHPQTLRTRVLVETAQNAVQAQNLLNYLWAKTGLVGGIEYCP